MPQFQIRRHPHGGTFQTFCLTAPGPTRYWFEGNSVQECVDDIQMYMYKNVGERFKFYLQVFPD